jgi:thioredoxin-like negative regulator of GroEL
MSIPTLMVFENGKMVKKSLGAKPKEDVLELIDE